jgi:hypothetical protein
LPEQITIHLDKPVQIDLLIKQLRGLKNHCLKRGGVRRAVFAGSNGNVVVFEAGLEPAGPSDNKPRTDPPKKPVQPKLFD